MFRSIQVYTDVASVIKSIDNPSPMLLSGSVTAGGTSLSLNRTMPNLTVGTLLLIDTNSTNYETVTVQDIEGTTITCSGLSYNHMKGVPVSDVTVIQSYLASASRFIDDVTLWKAGFAYESVTEILPAMIRGNVMTVLLSKPHVEAEDVKSVSITRPVSSDIDISDAWIEDDYFLYIPITGCFTSNVFVQVEYSGGFEPVPADISQAATAMSARMYKERQSGYSDVIASSETGTLTYQKSMPADVYSIVQRWKKWTM